MKGKKSKKNKPETREDVLQKAFKSMIESLNRFGPTEVLRILTANSHRDMICRDLLVRLPSVLSSSEFFNNLKVVRTNKATFHRLKKRGWII